MNSYALNVRATQMEEKMENKIVDTLSVEKLESSLSAFTSEVKALVDLLGLDMTPFQPDHIALRVNNTESAKALQQTWMEKGQLLSENIINGRPIVVVGLDTGYITEFGNIDCVELPFPGDKRYPVEGWEHIEWVIPSKAETVEALLEDVLVLFPALEDNWAQLPEMGVKVKCSSPKGEGERISNPTVAFKRDNICIKLHPVSLRAVIESESK